MTWANLGVLGVGAALISIPILLHFLMQPKPKDMVFPAMRFLKQRNAANRSRMRVRHLLLLLLRCILIGLIAIALAGPSVASNDFGNWMTLGGVGFSGLLVGVVLLFAWFRSKKNRVLIAILGVLFLGHVAYGGWAANKLLHSESAALIGDDMEPVAALIIMDTSPRMDYRRENQTHLEKAKEAGQWLVSQFPLDSQVCVLATDTDRPFFSVDVAAANRRIEKLKINFSGTSIPAQLAEGLKILAKSPQERKEIYIVTDLTLQSWMGDNAKPLVKELKKYVDTSLYVFDVGAEDPTNFTLGPLDLSESEISTDGQLSVITDVRRLGPAAQRTIKITLEKHTPGRPTVRDSISLFPESNFAPQSIPIDIRENSTHPITFSLSQPLDMGTYHGRVEIEGQDGLAIDNQRYFTIRVGLAKKTLVVHPDNVNPQVIPSLLESAAMEHESVVMLQDEFSRLEDPTEFDAIFLLDPRPVEDSTWQKLESFVEKGGGLGIFLGLNASKNGKAHPSFTTPAAQRVLSGKLDQQWFNETPDLFLSPNNLAHPIFDSIRDSATSILWHRFPIFVHWGIESDQNSEELPTQTLLRFGNREPAVIERLIGAGRVLIMTTPVTERGFYDPYRQVWNKLLIGRSIPAYLLLDGIAAHLTNSDADSLNIQIGQSATFLNDLREFPEVYQAFSPQPDKSPTPLNTVDGKIRYRFTDAPGHYRFKGAFNQEVVLRGFSANLSQSATDLTRILPDKLDSFLGPDRYQIARKKDEIQRQQGTARRGKEFYSLLILMMLVILAVEHLMSNRFYQTSTATT